MLSVRLSSHCLCCKVALQNGTDFVTILGLLREARSKGLTTPVLLMGEPFISILGIYLSMVPLGYYNPILAYGEVKAIQDAAEAGANGFLIVDLPPEEAITFRENCVKAWYVYGHPLGVFV